MSLSGRYRGLRGQSVQTGGLSSAVWMACLASIMLVSSVQADNAVRLVTGNNYSPFSDEGLPEGGMITEVVQRVFAEMGQDTELTFAPWSRGYRAMLQGEFDATFPYVESSERREDVYFSEPLYTVEGRVFVRADSSLTSLDQADGRRMCVPLGYAVSANVQAQLGDVVYLEERPPTMTHCFQMLDRDRVDMIAVNLLQGQRIARKDLSPPVAVRMLDEVLTQSDQHLVVARDHPEAQAFLDAFDQALLRLRENGVIESIENRHLELFLDAD